MLQLILKQAIQDDETVKLIQHILSKCNDVSEFNDTAYDIIYSRKYNLLPLINEVYSWSDLIYMKITLADDILDYITDTFWYGYHNGLWEVE